MDRRFLEKKKEGKRKKEKEEKQKTKTEKGRKKKEEENGKRKKEERKTPCVGYGHPVLGKIFKMFEFQGFNIGQIHNFCILSL